MSFDIFLQKFTTGCTGDADGDAVYRVLEPYFAGPPEGEFVRLKTRDGEATVYGIGTGSLMFNHVSGEHAWQIMYDVARMVGLTIMPVGCPVLICDDSMFSDLPQDLRGDVRTVESGADVLRAIRGKG
jgi:hypothetical protein